MKVVVKTLVDITETNARRGEHPIKSRQQDNYNTVIQTAGFRTNIVPGKIEKQKANIKDLGFGSKFKGNQNYWQFSFTVEYQDALTLEMLLDDFDLIPIVADLEETAKFDKPIFRTKDIEHCNVVFDFEDDK